MTSTETPSAQLKHDLLTPGVELIETHVSWVFLHGGDVWKVKKPVDLGFLDFSTSEKRYAACKAEIHLNRRLAPHVYQGCVPIVRDAAGRHRLDEPGEPVDWAVHMVRLPEDRRADALLAAGRLTAGDVDRVAERVAAFHAEARSDEDTARYGTAEAIGVNVRENFRQTRGRLRAFVTAEQAAQIEGWQRDFLERHGDLFAARVAAGRVRDGHGDLRLEHVYLDAGRVTIVDCIEFNQRFRFADVCADIAFLAMDLTWHGQAGLAERFLATYARAADDFDLYRLIDFYESYRAFVRGKVSTMLALEAGADRAVRERAAREARRYFLLALASERRSLWRPAVIAVGGWIAAGKSTLAEGLAGELAAPVVASDRTRKSLLAVAPGARLDESPWQGAYSRQSTERVYAELLRRAGAVVGSGRTVVLDASFHSREQRAAALRLAREHGVPFYFVECRTDPDVCRRRLARRDRESRVTDGRLEIFDDFLERWESVDELPAAAHLECDTTRPDCVEKVLARIPEAESRQFTAA